MKCAFPGCERERRYGRQIYCTAHYYQDIRGKGLKPLRKSYTKRSSKKGDCNFIGCGRPRIGKQLYCDGHSRMKVMKAIGLEYRFEKIKCSYNGCEKEAVSFNSVLCSGHQAQAERRENLAPLKRGKGEELTLDVIYRRTSKGEPKKGSIVDMYFTENKECYELEKERMKIGIGFNQNRPGSIVTYLLSKKMSLATKLIGQIDHLCSNPKCIRTEHLEHVSRSVNQNNRINIPVHRTNAIRRRKRGEDLFSFIKEHVLINEWGCWVWVGAMDAWGYGLTSVGAKSFKVHRVMKILSEGLEVWDLDPSMDCHHKCKNTLCCNPKHLEFVPRGSHKKIDAIIIS